MTAAPDEPRRGRQPPPRAEERSLANDEPAHLTILVTYALCCQRIAPVSTSIDLHEEEVLHAAHVLGALVEVWTLPVRKYCAPSCLPYCATCAGLNTGLRVPSISRDDLVLPVARDDRHGVRLDEPRLGLAQDRCSCDSMCSLVSFWNGKTVTTVLPRPCRHVSITGEVRRLFRFSFSIC